MVIALYRSWDDLPDSLYLWRYPSSNLYAMKVGGRLPLRQLQSTFGVNARKEMEHLYLADLQNVLVSHTRTLLTHPSEKDLKEDAKTWVEVSTWCERIAAPTVTGMRDILK